MKITLKFWHSQRNKELLGYVLALGLLIATIAFLAEKLVSHIHAFEQGVAALGPWAALAFLILYIVLCSMLLPESIMGIIAGVTFGVEKGVLIITLASLLAALFQYFLARTHIQPFIKKKIQQAPALLAIQSAVLQQQLKLQLLVRLTPLNRAVTSYILGAAGVRINYFIIACIAMVPNLIVEVYFGYAGKIVAQAATQGTQNHLYHEVVSVIGIVIAILVMAIVTKIAQKAVSTATENLTK